MKTQTKPQANKIKKQLIDDGKSGIGVYKFATKRKYQFFVGTWWDWMEQIS